MTRSRILGWPLAVLALGLVAASLPGQDRGERGAFLMRNGADTIVIERFARTADTVQGSIALKGQPRQDYVAVLESGGHIASLTLNIFDAGNADTAPIRRVRMTMRGDSVVADVGGTVQRFAVRPGAIPLLNNSFALAEIFTRRARAGGDAANVAVWALAGAVPLTVALRPLGADSMTLTVAGAVERLRVDRAGLILGGLIPSQHLEVERVGAAVAATLHLGATDYSAPAGAPYSATEVKLTGPGGIRLGGTLTLPRDTHGRSPAVVTITGSGQEDRDEYIPVAGGYRPFRQIADTLGRRGIAVLRLDDRTVGASGGALGTSADYADDIRAAVAYLRSRPEIDGDRIALLGHSEGGMIAPMVAATDPRIRAIVLMAGPAESGLDIIHYQQRNAIENDSTTPVTVRDSTIRAAAVTLDSIARTNAWLRFFLQYDPLATARRVRTPVLILQGSTDHQVTPDQAEKLAAAFRAGGNTQVTVHVFPGLDHLFVPDPSGQPAGYASLPSSRVTPEVLGTIADWLAAKLGTAK
ncbi:MAG: alpha/beta hydrolase family protein [Gemmatimonadales bacterium]